MTNQTPDEFKPSLPYTTYNDKGEPVMDIKAIKSGKQKAAKKRPYADRGNPSPDNIIHQNQPSSWHTHCFCIDVIPTSIVIGNGITKPHKKCCMCGEQILSNPIGGGIFS